MLIIPSDLIQLRKNADLPNIYDVALKNTEQLAHYDALECHLVLYPYSRKICSEHIKIFPFEEYVKDILTRQKSAYVELSSHFNELFGLFLGFLLTMIFVALKPADLFSVQSIISVIGVYFVGKDLWDDLETILSNLSKTWKLRYLENYYAYRLGKHTTLTNYAKFAKIQRYGKASLLPEKMDFIEQSNSQTVRMWFNLKDAPSFPEATAHVLSIHIDPTVLSDFEQAGFLFGVKLSLNKQRWGVTRSVELFQSLHQQVKGCLDECGNWIEGGIFYRKTWTCGRLKYFRQNGLLRQGSLIAPEN